MYEIKYQEKRLKKKLSIRELEELSGVSRTTISRLENGIIPKSLLELEALANALEVNIKSFFGELPTKPIVRSQI